MRKQYKCLFALLVLFLALPAVAQVAPQLAPPRPLRAGQPLPLPGAGRASSPLVGEFLPQLPPSSGPRTDVVRPAPQSGNSIPLMGWAPPPPVTGPAVPPLQRPNLRLPSTNGLGAALPQLLPAPPGARQFLPGPIRLPVNGEILRLPPPNSPDPVFGPGANDKDVCLWMAKETGGEVSDNSLAHAVRERKILQIEGLEINVAFLIQLMYRNGTLIQLPEAQSLPYEVDIINMIRMLSGRAPKDRHGTPVELHHSNQTQNGGLEELDWFTHRGPGNYSKRHTNTGAQPSQIDRVRFNQERKEHWWRRANYFLNVFRSIQNPH